MRIHRLVLMSLSLAGACLLTTPSAAEGEAAPTKRSAPSMASESPDEMLVRLESEFAEEQTRLAALRNEAQRRKDDARIKAVDQMTKEMMERRSMKMAELKAKMGEEGFAKAKARWEERRGRADTNKDGAMSRDERKDAMKKRSERSKEGAGDAKAKKAKSMSKERQEKQAPKKERSADSPARKGDAKKAAPGKTTEEKSGMKKRETKSGFSKKSKERSEGGSSSDTAKKSGRKSGSSKER